MSQNPASVAFTSQGRGLIWDVGSWDRESWDGGTLIASWLAPLTMTKEDNDFWLFKSGRRGGKTFLENDDGFQTLVGTVAFGATQRFGASERGDFLLILGDGA